MRTNGSLYRWGGSIAASRLVARLSPAYYANPALLHNAQSPTYATAANSAAAQAMGANAAQGVGGDAAEASLNAIEVAIAWLAVEDAGPLDVAASDETLASVAVASVPPEADLTASLHDQVLALLPPGDSPTRQQCAAAFDERYGVVVAANWADTDADSERSDAVDFVFAMPMEKFSPLGDLLA